MMVRRNAANEIIAPRAIPQFSIFYFQFSIISAFLSYPATALPDRH